jgi:hypothetical protein
MKKRGLQRSLPRGPRVGHLRRKRCPRVHLERPAESAEIGGLRLEHRPANRIEFAPKSVVVVPFKREAIEKVAESTGAVKVSLATATARA